MNPMSFDLKPGFVSELHLNELKHISNTSTALDLMLGGQSGSF